MNKLLKEKQKVIKETVYTYDENGRVQSTVETETVSQTDESFELENLLSLEDSIEANLMNGMGIINIDVKDILWSITAILSIVVASIMIVKLL